jgi:hypothetical protein
MIKMVDYPNVAINNVTGFSDIYSGTSKVVKRTMTIDQKIVFWKRVMALAKNRGFDFYLINWNTWVENANVH